MKNKLPNFLIVGAVKSGNTSLYYYLKQHPEVYMPANVKKLFAKILFPKEKRQKMIEKIDRKNLQKPPIKSESKKYFKNLYREDMLILQNLIKKDLSKWLK